MLPNSGMTHTCILKSSSCVLVPDEKPNGFGQGGDVKEQAVTLSLM